MNKQEKTLKQMKDRRKADYIFLRDIIAKKLKWAENEKQLGFKTLENLESQKQNVSKQILRLEGIILVLKELVELDSQTVSNPKEVKNNG